MLDRITLAPIVALLALAAEAPFQELSFDQALAAAAKDKKVVMVDFFTTWCGPCKKLDKTTWKDAEVQKWLGEQTVALKIDAEKERELADRFALTGYPTILFVKADGKELGRLVGYREAQQFLADARSTLAGKGPAEIAKAKLSGKENDPSARLEYGRELARAGRKDEALAEYSWCFDHGNENPWNGFTGVRLSFLLSAWMELAGRHPPALEALETRRDQAEKKLLDGTGGFGEAADVAALNRALGSSERTLKAFDQLRKDDRLQPAMVPVLLREIAPLLVDAKRYEDLLSAVGDPAAHVKSRIAMAEMTLKFTAEHETSQGDGDDSLSRLTKQDAVDAGSYLYEALIGTKQAEKATALAEQLMAFAPYGSTYKTLIQRAMHADAPDAARALAQRGLTTLPEKERRAVESAAKKIPDAK